MAKAKHTKATGIVVLTLSTEEAYLVSGVLGYLRSAVGGIENSLVEVLDYEGDGRS